MYKLINWSEIPKVNIAELKQLLLELVDLIANYDNLVYQLGFTVLSPIEPISLKFSIYSANYSQLLIIGANLEKLYLEKLNQFTALLPN